MRKYGPFILLGVAIILALVVSIMVYGTLQRAKVKKEVVPAVAVVVAGEDLSWGTRLTPGMVKIVALPEEAVPAGSFNNVEALKDRVLLASVKRNEPILEHRLAPLSITAGGLPAVINPEKRAMAVKVDEVVGVAGFIHPGDRVDVLVTIPERTPGVPAPLSKIVLQNMLVLAVGTEMEKKKDEEKPIPVKVVTLEVTPEEGEKLALAANEGKLQLALRNPTGKEAVTTRGATIPALLAYARPEKARVVAPKKELPPPAFTVVIIKGSEVTEVKFKME